MTVLHLDIGHLGKPKGNDRGATFGDRVESDLVSAYVDACIQRADERGVSHWLPTLPAWYGERQHEACDRARQDPTRQHWYLACHTNAGGAEYGLIGYDRRSKGGKDLAETLRDTMVKACPWLDRIVVVGVGADDPEPWKRNVYATIAGIWQGPANICGVCFEPGFIEHDQAVTPEALRTYGHLVADLAAGVPFDHGGDTPPEV